MAFKEIIVCLVVMSSCVIKAEHMSNKCNSAFYRPPKCVDTNIAYMCECGPGFEWNSNLCVSKAIDSRLEFLEREPLRYTLLLGKNFPEVRAFTISCWLKLINDAPAGTLLSYATRRGGEELQLTIGNKILLNVSGYVAEVDITFERHVWIHLAITWKGKTGAWHVYKNGILIRSGKKPLAVGRKLNRGGRLLVGQSADDWETINFTTPARCKERDKTMCPGAFQGELSYLNIWTKPLDQSHIVSMYKDCTFTYCGDAVEWVDFRSGTRGAMKLRWPSGIFQGHEQECQIDKEEKCDDWCTHTIGPQCDQQYSENILWPRWRSGNKSRAMPCPGIIEEPPKDNDNDDDRDRSGRKETTDAPTIHRAYRYCSDGGNFTGVWGIADTNDCRSKEHQRRIQNISSLLSGERLYLDNDTLILTHLLRLRKSSQRSRGRNPSDLAADIETVRLLIKVQNKTLDSPEMFRVYPTFDNTTEFAKNAMDVLNNVVDVGEDGLNTAAWGETAPRGYEAVQVLQVVNDLADLLVKSLAAHVKWSEINPKDARLKITKKNLGIEVRLRETKSFNTDLRYPGDSKKSGIQDEIIIPGSLLENIAEDVVLPEYLGVSNARFNSLAGLLPNHPVPVIVKFYSDRDKEFLHLEDNVNTAIMSARVHLDDGSDIGRYISMTNESDPIEYVLTFTDTRNYSNPECVSIDMDHDPPDYWEWIPEGCEVVGDIDKDVNEAMCRCYHLGIFAITTDMYDVNWDPGDPPRFEMNAASYIGILFSVSMYIVSLVTYIYLRCETDTVAIHRNLAACMVALQLSFLVGLGRTENETVCKMFAVLLHYLFIASFLWVCNEVFNLYVEVSNTIHTDTQQQRPMLRYYIIGWVVPAILVGVLVKVKWETYFNPEVCLIDTQHIWFLVGPVGGVWIVTVFVLVYTGKDIMESSYMKDREANKIIANHNKGCWIQNTLLMIAMAFQVCSAIMYSRIPQILFAMFAILQGAFFFMFFCVLNGEVVELLAERRTSLGINVASPSLPRSTKYSVYKRYVPIRSEKSGSSRRTSPTHVSGGPGSSPRPERKQKSARASDPEHHQSDDRASSPSTKGHRSLTTVSSSDSRADSPLIGLGSATLVRKLMPGSLRKKTEEDREEGDLAALALRSDSPEQEQPVSKDMVTTV